MTIQKLSPESVKIHLSTEEMRSALHHQSGGSNRMTKLIGTLMYQAESKSRIPFSQSQVSVELLTDNQGGMNVYFSLVRKNEGSGKKGKIHIAASFSDHAVLAQCCRRMMNERVSLKKSTIYQCENVWIIVLTVDKNSASYPYHMLMEYGRPYRMTSVNRARLSENSICLFKDHAVTQFASKE